ncbi:MAG: tetratricopeptide repeat protein, partial [Candidatus Obscuribacterales bacterium]|nr:tetratricopeptide repeat protein [Candidatus Obscuribacterales bacterium]
FHTNQCNRKKAWSEAARIAKQELQSPTGSQYPLPGDFRDVKGKFGLGSINTKTSSKPYGNLDAIDVLSNHPWAPVVFQPCERLGVSGFLRRGFSFSNQETNTCIKLGKLIADMGNSEQAERVYKSALSIAEKKNGKESPVARYALIELWDLYEKNGREKEAKTMRERLTHLLKPDYVEMMAERN